MSGDVRWIAAALQRDRRADSCVLHHTDKMPAVEPVSFGHSEQVGGECCGTVELSALRAHPDLPKADIGERVGTFRKCGPLGTVGGLCEFGIGASQIALQ